LLIVIRTYLSIIFEEKYRKNVAKNVQNVSKQASKQASKQVVLMNR